MNILVIAHYQDDGSPYVSFVHNQVKEFVKQGHQVTVIVPIVFGKKYKYLNRQKKIILDGIVIHYIDYVSFSKYGKYLLNNLCGYISIAQYIKKTWVKFPFDIIHAHTIIFDGYLAVKLKKKYHVPTVITTHGSDTTAEKNKGKGGYITNICKKADVIVTVSTKLKKELLQLCPTLKVHTILNGFCQRPHTLIKKNPYLILQVGSLIPQKKADITIEAFSRVLKKYPQSKLRIIGDGVESENLKKQCNALKITDYVCFYGYLDNEEVLKHMGESRIFVMPSVNEGFGIVYLEAMSQKCIVIGTKGEGIEDVIKHGENGFLVTPNNPNELADIIIKCLSSDDTDKIAYKAAKDSQNITWETNAINYINLFNKILLN